MSLPEPDAWSDVFLMNAQEPTLLPSLTPLFCLPTHAAESVRPQTPRPPHQPLPFRELPPRRKVV